MNAHYGPVFPPKLTGKGEPKEYDHIKEVNAFH